MGKGFWGSLLGAATPPLLNFARAVASPFKNTKPTATCWPLLGEARSQIMPTPLAEVDGVVDRLSAKSNEWSAVGCAERAVMLRSVLDLVVAHMEEAAEVTTQHKGSYGAGHSEEGYAVVCVAMAVREYAEAMEAGGTPKVLGVKRRPDGQAVVHVGPVGGLENMIFPGYRQEVWMKPDAQYPPTQGHVYRKAAAGSPVDGGVGVVLGAGNQWVITILDALHLLITENRLPILKMNPINEHIGPVAEKILAPFIERSFAAIVYGASEQGAHLVKHAGVSAVHMTGSVKTYDAIMWGGAERKASLAEPLCSKVVTAELGCVTPYIICPGKWTDSDMQYHARNIVSALVHNASHNCNAVKVLITSAAWPQRSEFLDLVRQLMKGAQPRVAYYPGSDANYKKYMEAYPDAEVLGACPQDAPGVLVPWTLQANISVADVERGLNDTCCSFEPWCGVLSEVVVPADNQGRPARVDDAGETEVDSQEIDIFLKRAVVIANERCFGSLSVAVFVSPDVMQSMPDEVDRTIAALRYGAIAGYSSHVLCMCVCVCV